MAALPGGRISNARAKNDLEWRFYESQLKPEAGAAVAFLDDITYTYAMTGARPARRNAAGYDRDATWCGLELCSVASICRELRDRDQNRPPRAIRDRGVPW